MDRRRVLVVDDHPLFLMGLVLSLKSEGFEVLETNRGRDVVDTACRRNVDAVVLDVRLPDIDGVTVAGEILKARPGTTVVMLSTYDLPGVVARAREVGASAFYSKEIDASVLAERLRRLLSGQPAATGFERVADWHLTMRERDVLDRLATGASNPEIANRLGVSPETVKDHVSALMAKFDVRDRVALTRRAIELGFVGPID